MAAANTTFIELKIISAMITGDASVIDIAGAVIRGRIKLESGFDIIMLIQTKNPR